MPNAQYCCIPRPPHLAAVSARLVDGPNTTSGRLEVKHLGRWGTVCSDFFTNAAAETVCCQLGLGATGTAVPGAAFGQGAPTAPVWLDDVTCRGSELRLEECASAGCGVTNCRHKEDVGVVCQKDAPAGGGCGTMIASPRCPCTVSTAPAHHV